MLPPLSDDLAQQAVDVYRASGNKPRDPETVEFKLHLAEDTYYETVLTPDEARKFALDLMIEAERALGCIAAQRRSKA